MAEYFEKDALSREIISDMASFVGDPDAVRKHDEQCNYAISCIESAPAADVTQVVHGRWIEKQEETYCPVRYGEDGEPILHKYTRYICNLCGRSSVIPEPYCHCGAKMDGGADF